MKCVKCGKTMQKAEGWVAGYPLGPKCFKKAFGTILQGTKSHVVTDEKTADLFADIEKTDKIEPSLGGDLLGKP